MTNEQILEQQVEALEKLLQLKQAVIGELEAKVQRLQNPLSTWGGAGQTISVPYVQTYGQQCVDGAGHRYPSTWMSTMPPSCTKCGAMSQGGAAGTYGGQITIGGGATGTLAQDGNTGVTITTTGSNTSQGCIIPLAAINAKQ